MYYYVYIYIRSHYSYDKYNACKLGRASNILDRENTYLTGEIKKGTFELVIRVKQGHEKIIENLLKREFTDIGLNIYYDAGTEFFDKKIKQLIIPYLKKLNEEYNNIWYQVLTQEEINELTRIIRNKKTIINMKNFIDYLKNNFIPNDQQIDVLNNVENKYRENNILKLIWSCGLGKTLLSIMIILKMCFQTNIIGVPSIFLQKQFFNEILKIFPNKNNILCVGGNTEQSTTSLKQIETFIKNRKNETIFIITTYDSCHLLLNFNFDFKIGDEAHHLVGIDNEETKNYKSFHKIQSNKTLFMTATEKNICNKNKEVYTMDDVKIFGEYLDIKSVKWAIDNHKITDYNLLILSNTENEIRDIIDELHLGIQIDNKELFLSAFMTLKSIEKYNNLTHVLICCNTTDSADLVNSYIKAMLDKKIFNINQNDVYYNSLHSKNKLNIDLNKPNNEIEKFKNAKFGIISSVYIFSEGFDLPKLSCVVFAENMLSEIRIVQTALRANRLDRNNPNKIAYIIIPYVEKIDFQNDKDMFNKVRIIISKMRNVDEMIEQKITITTFKKYENSEETTSDTNVNYDFTSDTNKFNKIKLRLKHSKSLSSSNSEEQDEYDYVKFLNKELNIKSKEMYVSGEIKMIHNNYIENADEYFKLNGVWTNWYDFIGIDTSVFIKDKQEWIRFCKKENVSSVEEYHKLCNKYEFLPKTPSEFYINFSNIHYELNLFRKRR